MSIIGLYDDEAKNYKRFKLGNTANAVFLSPAMKKLLLLLTCTMLVVALYGQQQRHYTSYTVDQGLAQNSVWDAFQDHKGFMWFGTADGVNRFDGYTMTHYRYHKGDSTSLIGNTFFRFYEDRSKQLWISHNRGISIYDRAFNRFKNIELTNTSQNRGETYTMVMGEDRKNRIWVVDYSTFLYCIDKKTHKIIKRINVSESNFPISSMRVSEMIGKYIVGYLNDSGTTWFRLDTETDEVIQVTGSTDFGGSFMCYDDSTLCAYSKFNMLFYNVYTNTFTSRPVLKNSMAMPVEARAVARMVFFQGNIWIGNNYGLFVFDTTKFAFVEHIMSFNPNEKVGFFYVQSLKKDLSGNLWVCTNGAGVHCLSPYNNKFKHYAVSEGRNSLIKAIAKDTQGNIYAGLYAQGLLTFKPDGKVIQHKFGRNEAGLTHVLALTVHDGYLYFTNDQYLKRKHLVTGKVDSVPAAFKRSYATGSYISYPVFRKWKQKLFVAMDFGICEITPDFKQRIIAPESFFPRHITTFEIVNDSIWWVGTSRKLYQYNIHRQRAQPIQGDFFVKSILVNPKGNEIWVGTHAGLFLFNRFGRLQREFGQADGLPDNFIYGILQDNQGQLWMSHNKGISAYQPSTRLFRNYTIRDGLQSNEFNTGAYYKDEKGLLYFGGVKGINVIDPDHIPQNQYAPEIAINEILVGDLSYKSDSSYNEIHHLKLSYLENTLSFDFSALEFSQPQSNSYQYKMEGVDEGWIQSGTRHFARYANLPPGHYVFKVKAANGDGYWNEVPRELVIDIIPPFWQRTWFYALMALLALIALAGIVYLFFQRQRRRLQRELELQQTIEAERLRISRDLHDNVGAQLSYLITNIEWMLEHPDELSDEEEEHRLRSLSETGRNAILTLRQTIWAIGHTEITVEDFADRFKQYALKMMEFNTNTQVHFTESFHASTTLTPATALNMFRICQEALHNSLKHAHCSRIDIGFRCFDHTRLQFTLIDNGTGFDWDEAIRKGHYGLVNMQARAQETHAELTIYAKKGKGTTLTLTLSN